MGIVAIMLAAAIPAVISLSKSSSGKSAVSTLMNTLAQARSLAVSSGSATYVVFADETAPEPYRCKAFVVFQEDKTTFAPVAVTKWFFLPTGISFEPGTGLLTAQGGTPISFKCPGTVGVTPLALPFLKFDATGMVAVPTTAATLFVKIFSGSVDPSGQPSFTDNTQKTTGKLDQVTVSRFTGRVRYVDPYAP